ncbi:MAG TPA: hypothetical protein VMR34_04040 [Candidatus Saccharimonadales bacterium]|jgi:hypothetical protein|nr:hypothetical protein [Candidatus Saccharimonadales bacterium]
MKSNPLRPTLKDKVWQQKIEKKIKDEKIKLDHSEGKDRFNKVIKKAVKKNI